MKYILILDDESVRHDILRKSYCNEFPKCLVVSVYRYRDFLLALPMFEYDIVHLDHDLGDNEDPKHPADTYYDGWGNKQVYDGCHATARICELSILPKKVIVQSHNTSCSPYMIKTLQRIGIEAVWEPFGEVSL